MTPTFKQAIENGIAQRGEFVYTGTYPETVEGWLTEHYAVADDVLFIRQQRSGELMLGYTVTHLNTGMAVLALEAHHIALNFMLELERVLLPFATPDDDYYRDVVMPYVKRRGLHACQLTLPKKLKAA